MSIADLRREYAHARLDEADVSHDPIVEFARWFAEAQEAKAADANAMTLATATAEGLPSHWANLAFLGAFLFVIIGGASSAFNGALAVSEGTMSPEATRAF